MHLHISSIFTYNQNVVKACLNQRFRQARRSQKSRFLWASISNSYKFQAECRPDVGRFLKRFVEYDTINISTEGFIFGCEVQMVSVKTIDEIREHMKKIVDGHVMIESLNYANEYTGERWFVDDY